VARIDWAMTCRKSASGLVRGDLPVAMKRLLTGRDCLTTDLRFPAGHHHRIRHFNFIERIVGEPRRCAKVIGRFPGETSCLALVWAVLDRTLTWRLGMLEEEVFDLAHLLLDGLGQVGVIDQ
jgi:transposase-like protein